jgi:signal transduction histidine kinase
VPTFATHLFRCVLQNLIDNAIRYGHEGGKVQVDLILARIRP